MCIFCGTAANEELEDIYALLIRKGNIRTATFNLNIISEVEFPSNYIFINSDILQISNLLNYGIGTIRNRHVCDPLKAICIFLHRITTSSR